MRRVSDLDALDDRGRELRRAHGHVVALHVLELVVVDVVEARELRVDDVLDRVEDAVVAEALDEVARDVDAAHVALDDEAGLEATELPVDDLGELVARPRRRWRRRRCPSTSPRSSASR